LNELLGRLLANVVAVDRFVRVVRTAVDGYVFIG
jgi:hypothetical protein